MERPIFDPKLLDGFDNLKPIFDKATKIIESGGYDDSFMINKLVFQILKQVYVNVHNNAMALELYMPSEQLDSYINVDYILFRLVKTSDIRLAYNSVANAFGNLNVRKVFIQMAADNFTEDIMYKIQQDLNKDTK
mgnify:CR=1 FL=1